MKVNVNQKANVKLTPLEHETLRAIFYASRNLPNSSELEEAITFADASKEDLEKQFSTEFIQFSKTVAEKIQSQTEKMLPEMSLKKIAKSLANYTD